MSSCTNIITFEELYEKANKSPSLEMTPRFKMEDLLADLGIDYFELYELETRVKIEKRLREIFLASWICTDTRVGLSALIFDNKPVCAVMQRGRKWNKTYEWVSMDDAFNVRCYLKSLMHDNKLAVHVLKPNTNFKLFVDREEEGNKDGNNRYSVKRPVS